MEVPETRYAKTIDGVHIAYQVIGDGPIDLVFAFGEISNVDAMWTNPPAVTLIRGLASFSRVLFFDRRGTGISDRRIGDSAFEAGMDDIRAVMDAAGSERALLLGFQDGGMLCSLFAASFPERTFGLVLFNTVARSRWAPDYPWGWSDQEWDDYLRDVEERWGTLEHAREHLVYMDPGHTADAGEVMRFAILLRAAGSPGDILRLEALVRDADIREVLPAVHVPTLVLFTDHEGFQHPEEGPYLAERIAGCEFVRLPGAGYTPFFDARDPLLEHVERFARRIRDDESELDRVLATVLFTDIVDSTAQSAAMGDRAWTDVRAQHDQLVRSSIARFRGREIKTMGDGFLATFDGPARGVRCAQAIVSGTEPLGIEVRAGLHTGEVAFEGDDIAGLGVAIGARVGAKAGASQVLVSQTVKDLVAGSGLTFEDAGEHDLKGVPDRWHLYRVVD
jgi:class 3 adenylate cyclase